MSSDDTYLADRVGARWDARERPQEAPARASDEELRQDGDAIIALVERIRADLRTGRWSDDAGVLH